jgi:LPXTG-motif cell wall-anchored protein
MNEQAAGTMTNGLLGRHWVRARRRVAIAVMALVSMASFFSVVQVADATPTLGLVHQLVADGTPTFDAAAWAGFDTGATNGVTRNLDIDGLKWAVNVNRQSADTATISQTLRTSVDNGATIDAGFVVTIDAVDNSFTEQTPGASTLSVLSGDLVSGVAATTTTAKVTPGTPTNAGLLMNADGTVAIAATTPPGTYTYPYTICSTADPTVCDTAIATIAVAPVGLPAISKTGTVVAGPDAGSTSTARSGDTIDWRVSFDNTGGAAGSGSITDVLPAGTTFVPGSLELPGRWTAQYSTNAGTTFATPEPATAVNALKVAVPVGEKVGYESGSAEFPKPPLASSTQAGTSGDGYVPLPVGNKIYNVFHHQIARLYCTLKANAANCFPGTTGYYFDRTNGVTLTGSKGAAPVAVNNRSDAMFVAATNEMWIAGDSANANSTSAGAGGFACMNLSTTPPKACSPAWVGAVSGQGSYTLAGTSTYYVKFSYIGTDAATSRMYGQDDSGMVYCLDGTTRALCAGWTVTSASGLGTAAFSNGYNNSAVFGSAGKIILTNNGTSGTDYVTCLDSTTGLRCAGWPAVPALVPGQDAVTNVTGNPTPRFTAPNFTLPTGACFVHHNNPADSAASTSSIRFTTCLSLADGTTVAVPPNFEAAYPVQLSSRPNNTLGEPTFTPDGKVFQAWTSRAWNVAEKDDVYSCYDYATGNACAGFVGGKDFTGAAATEYPYAVRVDDLDPQCVWALGDVGNLRSFDTGSGGPCAASIARFTVEPRKFYCAASAPDITAWTRVDIANLPSAAYTRALLTVKDKAGNIIAGYDNSDVTIDLADGSLDISAIPYAGDTTKLDFNLQLRGANAPMFNATPAPFVAAAWVGPPVEMCFKTTITDVCTVSQISNTAQLAFLPDNGANVSRSASKSFEYLASGKCIETTKTVASGPTANGDGTYTVAYDIGVKNTSPARSAYDLKDEFRFGTGVSASGTPTVANTSPGTITTNAGWNGASATNIVTGEAILGSTSHTYRVNATAIVPARLAATVSDCTMAASDTGTGLRNEATTGDAAATNLPVSACAPLPSIATVKSVASGPTTNSDGSWTITYNIAVTNSGAGAGVYDMSDTLAFGTGISVVSAGVTSSPAGATLAAPAWNGTTNSPIITARTIAAGATETYTVTVRASAPGGVPAAAKDCSLDGAEAGTGLRNEATTTVNGATTKATACAPVTNVINAVDNDFGTVTGGGLTASVLGGDTLNGAPATLATVNVNGGTSPNPGLLMNADGTITVDPTTPPGTYSYPYKICSKVDPSVCDTAVAIVKVGSVIDATDNMFGVTEGGSTTSSVLGNDTLNGIATTLDNVTLTPGVSPNAGLTMNPDGTISVAPNTPPGTYSYPYTICSKTDPTVCDTAIATVITLSKIDAANNDFGTMTGGGKTPSVLAGDTLNLNPATTANVTLTSGVSPNPGLVMNPDGTITVAATTPPGDYTYPYTICSKVDPTQCDSAVATVNVGSVVNATDDDFGTMTGGGLTASILGNDTLNGKPATAANVSVIPGTPPNPGLLMNPDGTISVDPTTPPGVYNYPYTICSKTDPLVCDTAVATLTVGSVINAVDDVYGIVAGGGTTPSVLLTDTLNGNPTTTTNVTLTPGTSPNAGITMNPDGTITVSATTPPGTYIYPYTICSKADPTICDTAIATIKTPSTIDAVDNDFGTITGGGTTGTVLTGDTLNGNPVDVSNVTITPGTSPKAGLVMNPDGTITVDPKTPPGTYIYPYTICSKVDPTECDTAFATLNVAAVVNAPDDTFGPMAGGGLTPSVLDNDTLNGMPATPGTVKLAPGVSSNPGLMMNPDGTITVAPTTPPGTYTYPYTICSIVDPLVCDTATATVTVPVVVNAVDDSMGVVPLGAATSSVLVNDTLNGNPVTVGATGNATLTPGTSPNAGLTMNPDGTITVAPTTPPGTYSYPYTICSKIDSSVCDTAVATLTVGAVVDAVNDPLGNQRPGSTTPSVLDNDTVTGVSATPTIVTLTPGLSPNAGLTMNPDGTITIAATTPPGTYRYPYTICSTIDPASCDTAIATLVVLPTIEAIDDPFGTVKPGMVTGSVVDNDTVNGVPATLTNVVLKSGTSPHPGLVMNGDGTITVGSVPPGAYSFPYAICAIPKTSATSHLVAGDEAINPEGCVTATATITVAPVIDASENVFATRRVASGPTTTPSVLENDMLNGLPVGLETVKLTAGPSPVPGMTMNADGTITVDRTVPVGEYRYAYTICSIADPTICQTSEAILTVMTNRLPTTGSNPHTLLVIAVAFTLAGSAFGLLSRRRRVRR